MAAHPAMSTTMRSSPSPNLSNRPSTRSPLLLCKGSVSSDDEEWWGVEDAYVNSANAEDAAGSAIEDGVDQMQGEHPDRKTITPVGNSSLPAEKERQQHTDHLQLPLSAQVAHPAFPASIDDGEVKGTSIYADEAPNRVAAAMISKLRESGEEEAERAAPVNMPPLPDNNSKLHTAAGRSSGMIDFSEESAFSERGFEDAVRRALGMLGTTHYYYYY